MDFSPLVDRVTNWYVIIYIYIYIAGWCFLPIKLMKFLSTKKFMRISFFTRDLNHHDIRKVSYFIIWDNFSEF
jgi:hypothetical protein